MLPRQKYSQTRASILKRISVRISGCHQHTLVDITCGSIYGVEIPRFCHTARGVMSGYHEGVALLVWVVMAERSTESAEFTD